MNGIAGRRFLVTGGGGFLGGYVVRRLAAAGAASVFVPRRDAYDLRDRAACERAIADGRPDIVIHAAGVVGGIAANAAAPGTLFYDNAVMGIHMIEACRIAAVEKLVTVGSVCAYPLDAPLPLAEGSLWDGLPEPTNAAYGLAKRMLLAQQQAYRTQFGMNAIYLLPTNLYGPGDDFDPQSGHVIAALIRKFVDAAARALPAVTLWGSGGATRDFLFVDDAARAIVMLAASYDDGEPVNLGSGAEVTVRELAARIARLSKYRGSIRWDTTMPEGQPRRVVSAARAARLGFTAETTLDDGLSATIAWYRASGLPAARQ